jgi:hypothetical protein
MRDFHPSVHKVTEEVAAHSSCDRALPSGSSLSQPQAGSTESENGRLRPHRGNAARATGAAAEVDIQGETGGARPPNYSYSSGLSLASARRRFSISTARANVPLPLLPSFALLRTGDDRVQIVAPDGWSLAAGRTLEGRELRAADMAPTPARRPRDSEPTQRRRKLRR